MYIKLYKGFLSPIELHKEKKYQTPHAQRIEGRLESYGFRIYGSNYAIFDCKTLKELTHTFMLLKALGINGGEVGWL